MKTIKFTDGVYKAEDFLKDILELLKENDVKVMIYSRDEHDYSGEFFDGVVITPGTPKLHLNFQKHDDIVRGEALRRVINGEGGLNDGRTV